MKSNLFNFEKITKNAKNLQEIDILKVVFAIFLFVLMLFVVINETTIHYFLSGISSLSNFQLYVLDVGQASASVVVLPDKTTFVVDTGSKESAGRMLSQMKQIFTRNKISEIDFLILSHSDADHVGGTMALLDEYQVNNIIRPKILSTSEVDPAKDMLTSSTLTYAEAITAVYNEPNCNVTFAESVKFDELGIQIFAAEKYYTDTNSYSPFISVEYAGKSFLLTGDATDEREKEFMSAFKRSDGFDFLVVAHHGSKYSTSSEFLDFVSPKYALISAGDSSHPSQEVISRLKTCGVNKIYCTKTDGLIGISVQESGKFVICVLGENLDIPLLVVVVCCGIFVIFANLSPNKRKTLQFSIKNFVN